MMMKIIYLQEILLRVFSGVFLASSTTKAGRHDIAEILLKVALDTRANPYWTL
jgi:hypothetical protein